MRTLQLIFSPATSTSKLSAPSSISLVVSSLSRSSKSSKSAMPLRCWDSVLCNNPVSIDISTNSLAESGFEPKVSRFRINNNLLRAKSNGVFPDLSTMLTLAPACKRMRTTYAMHLSRQRQVGGQWCGKFLKIVWFERARIRTMLKLYELAEQTAKCNGVLPNESCLFGLAPRVSSTFTTSL